MEGLRAIAIGGSLLSVGWITGCFGLLVPGGSDRALVPSPSPAETSQVRTNLQALTRGQQAYYLESDRFASNLEELGLGITPGEGGYQIAIADLQPTQVILTATPKQPGNPNFAAGVFVTKVAGNARTVAIQCASDTGIPFPRLDGTEAICDDAQ